MVHIVVSVLHGGTQGEQGYVYSSTHSLPRHYLELNKKIHAPATLTQGKEPLVPTEEEKNLLPLSGIECRIIQSAHRFLCTVQ